MLDKSRHFGTVHGISNAVYAQDGKYFDVDGNEIQEENSFEEESPDEITKRRGRPRKIIDEII